MMARKPEKAVQCLWMFIYKHRYRTNLTGVRTIVITYCINNIRLSINTLGEKFKTRKRHTQRYHLRKQTLKLLCHQFLTNLLFEVKEVFYQESRRVCRKNKTTSVWLPNLLQLQLLIINESRNQHIKRTV